MAGRGCVYGDQIQGGRPYQEDSFRIERHGEIEIVLALADGMGGHAGGGIASRLAVDAFVETVLQAENDVTADRLAAGLAAANAAVAAGVDGTPALAGMGCTLVGAVIAAGRLCWISVGDSPLWLLRDGTATRLNEDHSMLPLLLDMAARGKISEDEALTGYRRHQLRSAVSGGVMRLIDAPADPLVLASGDQLLLASDGLDVLPSSEWVAVAEAMRDRAGEAVVSALLESARAKSGAGQDNTTVIYYRHLDG